MSMGYQPKKSRMVAAGLAFFLRFIWHPDFTSIKLHPAYYIYCFAGLSSRQCWDSLIAYATYLRTIGNSMKSTLPINPARNTAIGKHRLPWFITLRA